MVVTQQELERGIERLRGDITDPRAGIYGPGSLSWMIDRELINFLAGGRAALLQLAHPFVAHAIDQHSNTRHDPFGRFQRTFRHVYAMVFGDLNHAISSARRVHAIHQRIYGTMDGGAGDDAAAYNANDPNALFWVHATLVESAVRAFELIVRKLTPSERDRYLDESRRFALLFGIPDTMVPNSWRQFEAYNEQMWDSLQVAQQAAEIASFLFTAPTPALQPLADWYRVLTTGLLPAQLREPFGLVFGRREQLLFDTSVGAIRLVYRRLPSRLRQVPAYSHAVRRLRGKEGPDPIAHWLEKLLLDADLAPPATASD